MADGSITLELDSGLSEKLFAAADEAGCPVQDFAHALIELGLDDRLAIARARLAEFERTGESVDAKEALTRFRAAIAERLRNRA